MHNVELILPKNENLIKEAVTVLGGNVVPLKIASHRNSKVENITNMKHKLLVEEAVAALNDEPVNSQPSGAYLIDFDTIYSDSISGQGKRRWYFFQLAERKKITLYMSPTSDTTVDNDLILYKLDTATGALTELARSSHRTTAPDSSRSIHRSWSAVPRSAFAVPPDSEPAAAAPAPFWRSPAGAAGVHS